MTSSCKKLQLERPFSISPASDGKLPLLPFLHPPPERDSQLSWLLWPSSVSSPCLLVRSPLFSVAQLVSRHLSPLSLSWLLELPCPIHSPVWPLPNSLLMPTLPSVMSLALTASTSSSGSDSLGSFHLSTRPLEEWTTRYLQVTSASPSLCTSGPPCAASSFSSPGDS